MSPTHLVAGDALTTRCGITLGDRRANPYPYLRDEFIQTHIDGHARAGKPELVFCLSCLDRSGLATPQPPAVNGQLGLFEEPA